jgi:hypothetical protein
MGEQQISPFGSACLLLLSPGEYWQSYEKCPVQYVSYLAGLYPQYPHPLSPFAAPVIALYMDISLIT